MSKYPFSLTSRILNFFRRITRIPFIEKIIVQQNLNGNKFTPHFTLTNNPGKEYDAQIYSLGSYFEC